MLGPDTRRLSAVVFLPQSRVSVDEWRHTGATHALFLQRITRKDGDLVCRITGRKSLLQELLFKEVWSNASVLASLVQVSSSAAPQTPPKVMGDLIVTNCPFISMSEKTNFHRVLSMHSMSSPTQSRA